MSNHSIKQKTERMNERIRLNKLGPCDASYWQFEELTKYLENYKANYNKSDFYEQMKEDFLKEEKEKNNE